VITEKRLALSHHAFWRDLLPTMFVCVRRINAAAKTFADELTAPSSPRRGMINETGFHLFAAAVEHHARIDDLDREVTARCEAAAADFIRRFRAHSRELDTDLLLPEIDEAKALARRLRDFFDVPDEQVVTWPHFPGCGWLDAAEGDVMVGSRLFEVKAGGGAFRGQDLRQMLCYVALAHSAGSHLIGSLCLLNPRTGRFLEEDLDTLCLEASGNHASEIIHEIIAYISEPLWELHD
jgi:hypothetical protein